MAIFTTVNVIISLLAIYLTRRIHCYFTTGRRLRAFAAQHGCLSAKRRQTPFTFGLCFWYAQIKAIKEHRLLPHMQSSFSELECHTRHHYILGTDIYTTEDPENVKAVLATDFSKWSLGRERIDEIRSYLGMGIFVNEGAAWKHSREMLRPCFERSVISDTESLERHVQRLFELVPKDGSAVDLQPLLHDLSMDMATDLLFGRSTNALDKGQNASEVQAFCDAFDYASNPFEREAFKKWGTITLFLPDRFNKAKKKHVKIMQDFVDRIIDAHIAGSRTEGKQRYNFISALLEATPNRTTIRSELLNILLAGRDTVASLLSNLIWNLPRHPSVLARLRVEIEQAVGSNAPTYEQLKDMRFLKAVVSESQRLYPVVPLNSREALEDTLLPRGGGAHESQPVLVPKGSYVAWHMYSMQRRSDLFGADADAFRPERWLEPGFRPGWAFVPFSGGPRVCIGQSFALTEAMYVVVRLVQGFDIERRDFDAWREKFSITCTGLNGCKVGLTPRT
ncbi:cytochrome P450 [Didymella exigua CBS 183.55]|uniref:Cytochrome P450 n=1 Tax=Didymella exigua CBS 183.55 TaxID=1150837 RepID=A0A6A5RC53_9PLEO|nr:cytochrome P450 [Didymella exigua CBS 183.55]KAF1924654.1 cytochrome P450 [Didymella exigua CBS 183.55]